MKHVVLHTPGYHPTTLKDALSEENIRPDEVLIYRNKENFVDMLPPMHSANGLTSRQQRKHQQTRKKKGRK